MAMETPAASSAPAPYTVGAAITFGWKKSWKNFWWLLLVAIIMSAINGVVNAIFTWHGTPNYDFSQLSNPSTMDMGQVVAGQGGMSGAEAGLVAVGGIVQFLVSIFFALGIVRIALAVTTGDRVHIGKLFGFHGYGRYLGSSIIVGIVITIGIAIPTVIGLVITIAANQVAWVIIGLLLGIILGFVVALFFCLYGYAILGEEAKGLSGLSRSWDLVKPHFGQILGLQVLLALITIGIVVVAIVGGILLICIGLLATIPIALTLILGIPALAYAYTYRVLSGQPVA